MRLSLFERCRLQPRALARALCLAGVLCPLADAQSVAVTLRSFTSAVNLGPNAPAEPAWTYGGTLPGTTLRITEGQTLRVTYLNNLTESSIVHWHGQPQPLPMDGMGGISRPETAPGQEYRYILSGLEAGTYLYHPHPTTNLHQLERGLYGVLIVDPADPTADPASDVDQVVVLDDWLQPFGGGFSGHLINGRTSSGQSLIRVAAGDKLRLRFVNAASHTNYIIALDGHQMTVTHADGRRVQPVVTDAIPLGIGERYDVIVDCTRPGRWSLAASTVTDRNTTLVRTVVEYASATGATPLESFVPQNLSSGALLSYAQLASLDPSSVNATPNFQQTVTLDATGGSQPSWSFNNQVWPVVLPTQVAMDDIVRFDLQGTTQQFHPLHLHGHSFQLLTAAGGVTHAPVKDSLLISPQGQAGSQASIQFEADNPGFWLLHSQHLDQWAGGMVAAIEYTGDTDSDGIGDATDLEPRQQNPATLVPADGAAFLPGGSGDLRAQWQPNQGCAYLVSPFERVPPLALPPNGTLYLSSLSYAGVAMTDASGWAALPYAIPNDPVLRGFRVLIQPMCGTQLIGVVRLGTMQAFRVR